MGGRVLAGRWKLTQVLITLVNADLSGPSRVRRERTPAVEWRGGTG